MAVRVGSIAGWMAVVVLAALDCAAWLRPISGRPTPEALALLGALPMANVLALGLLRATRPGPAASGLRAWLAGFEAVGWSVLLAYTVVILRHPDAVLGYLGRALGPLWPLSGPAFHAAVSAALLLPQVALAAVGGWASLAYARADQGRQVPS